MEPTTAPEASGGKLRLLGFSALVLAGGAALDALAGPPRLPSALPSLTQLRTLLTGSTLPLDGLAYAVVTLAWVVWLWIVASLAVQLVVLGLELVARGSAAVVLLRQIANRVSLPVARRLVTTAFAVQVLTRAVPVAAAPIETVAPIALVTAPPEAPRLASVPAPGEASPTSARYLVQPRDTLWSIAATVYGNPHDYRRLVDANVGRRMPDGQLFTKLGVIQPGWVLDVPQPSSGVEEVDGQRFYTVAAGDTLSGIAARLLGTTDRWTELFSLNQGQAHLADGRSLTNPNLIWPGLRLRLPDTAADAEPEPAALAVAAVDAPETAADAEPEPDALAIATADAPVPPPTPGPDSAPPDAASPAPVGQPAPSPTADQPASKSPPLDLRAPDRVDPYGKLQPIVLSTVLARATPAPTPPPESVDQPQPEPDSATHGTELPMAVAAGAVGIAGLAGAAALGVQRVRRLRPLHQEPESEIVVEGGYAEAQLTTTLTHRLHGGRAEPVVILATQLRRFLSQRGLSEVQLIAVRHGRSATTLVLAAGLADQPRLLELARPFADRLHATAEAWVSEDHDVLIKLAHPRLARLLAPAEAATPDPVCLLPIGLLYDRQILYAEWRALGHVLVASLPGHGADTILTSLLATLTARRSPDELCLWTIARPRDLPAPLGSLPHQRRMIDAGDEQAVAEAVRQLRSQLEGRMAGHAGPELLAVVSELTSLQDQAADLELIAHHGPQHGIRLLVATTDPEGLHHPLLPVFATRLVLQAADEESSVALIGGTDAAYLGGGGRLLLRLDARQSVEVYGYRVAPDHLDRLVTVMRTAYELDNPSPLVSPRATPTVVSPHPPRPTPPMAPAPPPPSAGLDAAPPAGPLQPGPVPSMLDGPPTAPIAPGPPPPSAPLDAAPSAHIEPEPSPAPLDVAPTAPPLQAGPPPSAQRDAPAAAHIQPGPSRSATLDAAPTAHVEPGPSPSAILAEPPTALPLESQPSPSVSVEAPPTGHTGVAAPPLEIICLGGPRVMYAGQQVWPTLTGGDTKPWEVLIFVATHPAGGVTREGIVSALWPDDLDADANHRLRQLRYRLRSALERAVPDLDIDPIRVEHGVLSLHPAVARSDAQAFLDLIETARSADPAAATALYQQARALYQGDLLDAPDARRFAWVDERPASGVTLREAFRAQFHAISINLAELCVAAGRLEDAGALYRELTLADPGDEALWRALFRVIAARGDRPGLADEERRMRRALQELEAEAGGGKARAATAEPSQETVGELQRLREGIDAAERTPSVA